MTKWHEALIASVLVSPEDLAKASFIPPEAFPGCLYDLWKAILVLGKRNAISLDNVITELGEKALSLGNAEITTKEADLSLPALEQPYIRYLVSIAETTGIEERIARVQEWYTREQLVQSAQALAMSSRNGKPLDEIIKQHRETFSKIVAQGSTNVKPISHYLDEYVKRTKEIMEGIIAPYWTPPLDPLASLIGEIDDVDFILLAAETGLGKTHLSRELALLTALGGEPACIISMENSSREITTWCISHQTGIPYERLKNPRKLSHEEIEKHKIAIKELSEIPLVIEEVGIATFERIYSTATKFKTQYENARFIVVDGAYLIRGGKQSQFEDISTNLQGLRSMCMELHVPILATTQFNRKNDGSRKHKLSDLFYSGEMQARIVMFLEKVEMTAKDAAYSKDWNMGPDNIVVKKDDRNMYPAHIMRLNVMKNTGGKLGQTSDLLWIRPIGQYLPLKDGWRNYVTAPENAPLERNDKGEIVQAVDVNDVAEEALQEEYDPEAIKDEVKKAREFIRKHGKGNGRPKTITDHGNPNKEKSLIKAQKRANTD